MGRAHSSQSIVPHALADILLLRPQVLSQPVTHPAQSSPIYLGEEPGSSRGALSKFSFILVVVAKIKDIAESVISEPYRIGFIGVRKVGNLLI